MNVGKDLDNQTTRTLRSLLRVVCSISQAAKNYLAVIEIYFLWLQSLNVF